MGLKFEDKNATNLVISWQQNPSEEIAEQVLEIYHPFLKAMIHKYRWVEDVSGVVYENFMKCMKNFDVTKHTINPCFTAYLIRNVKIAVLNQAAYMKHPKYGALKLRDGLTSKGKDSFKLDRSGENNWISIYTPAAESGSTLQETISNSPGFEEELITKMIWDEAQSKIAPEKEKYLQTILLALDGYTQKEMESIMNISQSRVSTMKRDMSLRNSEFYNWLYQALKEEKF